MDRPLPADHSIGGQLRAIDLPHQITLVLLAQVLGKPKSWILAHPEFQLSTEQNAALDSLIARLKAGEPLPYLTGKQEFFGLEFKVTPATLIPRPETELLVEETLKWLKAHGEARIGMDIATGSGCIAISLLVNCPDLHVTATDISKDALQIARENACHHNVEDRITFFECDLIPPDSQKVDLLCANLPYIPTKKLAEVNSLPWEPRLALDGGADGLTLFRQLFNKIKQFELDPSLILLELEETLGQETLTLCQNTFPKAKIDLLQDLSGRDRLIRIENIK